MTARLAIGQAVAVLRKRQALSTAKLGELCGLPAGRVWAIENGSVAVRSADLLLLAKGLKVSPLCFFEAWSMGEDSEADGVWKCLNRR